MEEIIANLHMHTLYSDGFGRHSEIAEAAMRAGLDVVIVTDHNVYVSGVEDYYHSGDQRVLLLVGEEIHNQTRLPQKSHLLVFGAGKELAPLGGDLTRLLAAVRQAGGLAFIAHPTDPAAPAVQEDDLSWDDWQITGLSGGLTGGLSGGLTGGLSGGLTGIEIWNAMSEFKSLLKTKLHALYYAYNPTRIAHRPFRETLQNWDNQLLAGQRLAAIGGSDAHALPARLGPLRKTLFPYEFHFRAINTHLLIERPLEGDLESDRQQVLQALARGRSFIANDLLVSARGFRFAAHGLERIATLGEEISAARGITFQIRLPEKADCQLIHNGKIVQTWERQARFTYITTEPGFYRVEAYLNYKGLPRGWIFSNPIFIKN